MKNLVYFQKGGNKMKKMEKSCRFDLKQLFTIHLFTFSYFNYSLKIKNKCSMQIKEVSSHFVSEVQLLPCADAVHVRALLCTLLLLIL